MNLYEYCISSPIGRVDWMGLKSSGITISSDAHHDGGTPAEMPEYNKRMPKPQSLPRNVGPACPEGYMPSCHNDDLHKTPTRAAPHLLSEDELKDVARNIIWKIQQEHPRIESKGVAMEAEWPSNGLRWGADKLNFKNAAAPLEMIGWGMTTIGYKVVKELSGSAALTEVAWEQTKKTIKEATKKGLKGAAKKAFARLFKDKLMFMQSRKDFSKEVLKGQFRGDAKEAFTQLIVAVKGRSK